MEERLCQIYASADPDCEQESGDDEERDERLHWIWSYYKEVRKIWFHYKKVENETKETNCLGKKEIIRHNVN